ncbi:hypothetical protein AWE51_12750 [Aquimarina aggregata]|uniref:DUF11 domain-containing protein n=1 Tax=Aquimarina aggregata TaxID=1642818 RepID=A0A162YWC3_9FLAO|nr:T9SS type B sorting domain-containing protein [Aquimarina aggregata]KZS39403.1 hypothetical protein AWE51_12750 [Aquimarina aggregata]
MKQPHFTLLLLVLFPFFLHSQVPTDINSGNPNFPFPQFLAYEYNTSHRLENLANQNADGLVHAEMEKRIREAWRIMANRFKYTGESHAGVPYLYSNIGCPYDCSEGVGYGMIAAAYMGDKTIFDGIWFREHDVRMVKHPRYIDGNIPRPTYAYGDNSLAEPNNGVLPGTGDVSIGEVGNDSATDGDVDIALGLLMAWKQWGDDSGYLDSRGNKISYKQEALNVIRGLVEIQDFPLSTGCDAVVGVIGFDGYFKDGNSQGELTNWALGQNPCPEGGKVKGQLHIDYVAPAYCKAFGDFLEAEGDPSDVAWNIPQFRRAEASSDWLMGELYKQGPNTIPTAGDVFMDAANNATFANFNPGEDFRHAWRTILNHTWHGNPENSWNPTTHQVIPGANSINKDMGQRFSKFLADPAISGNPCVIPGGALGMTFQGPSQLLWQYDPNTGIGSGFTLNWTPAAGTPSAVSSQDFDLMGKLYRQCAIEWEQQDLSIVNLDSNPTYFHGFFRLLGMLITTGNFQSPMNIKPEANIKVYTKVDKTAAFTGDEVTFTISYRNYGSVAAQNVIVQDVIPVGLEFVSATNGGVHTGGTVSWNIGTVSGFKSTGGITPTTGEVKVTCKVQPSFSGRICNPVTITTTNGKGWTSNDFPNNLTPVMERNCVDIIEKALEIEKTVDFDTVNPGDVVTYSINFKNSSKGGYINGGRSGVNFAYARSGAPNGNTQGIKVSLYHGAAEPYINYENYRISLFLNDNTFDCLSGEPGCTNGWGLRTNVYEGGSAGGIRVSHENIVPGSDAKGAWNQRVIVQFSDQLCAPTPHLLRYSGTSRIHEGGSMPLRAIWDLFTSNFGSIDWSDDWSWDATATDLDTGFFYPITDDWTDPENPIPVDKYHNEACEKPTKTVNNILVEEWDGYVWRRVFGTGPVPGRDVENVVITDILPQGFTFVEFVGDSPLGIAPIASTLPDGRTEIRWEIPRLQISQGGTISYKARADFSSGTCDRADEVQTNSASITALNESAIVSTADVTITCNPVILPPKPSSMTKIATPKVADVGDQVVYTLAYTNTDGSPIEVDFNDTNNWTAQTGTKMGVTGGSLASVPNNLGVSTYNYSHGTNGTLEATIDFDPNQAFGFTMRHTGGAINNGLYIVFKPNPGGGSVDTQVYNGTSIIDQTTLGFPGNPMDIKLLLNGNQLNVWLGNTTNPTPTWSVTGLPVKAGSAGFINAFPDGNDASGSHTVSRFKTSMDSAFNVQITDPIPSEVSFVSASDSGTSNANIVTYPIIPGPVLAGEIINYTWTALINSCPTSTSKIVNIGYTNILGVPNNSIAAQALVDCSGIDLCATPIPEPIVNNANFCLNDSPADLNTFISATETIIWYANDLNTSPPIAKPTVDTSISSNTTYYVSQQDSNSCESTRIPIIVKVIDPGAPINDTKTIVSATSVRYDITVGFGLTLGDFTWTAMNNPEVNGATVTNATDAIIDDILVNTTSIPQVVTYLIESNTAGACGSTSFELEVIVNPLPSVTLNATSVIEGESIEVSIELNQPSTTDITLIIGFTGVTADLNDVDLSTERIIILAGQTTATFIRSTIDDILVESNETISIGIDTIETGSLSDSNATAIATIFDNDGVTNTPQITLVDNTVEEGSTLNFSVTLDQVSTEDIMLTFGIEDITTTAQDYEPINLQITILAGETNSLISIPTVDDTIEENNETMLIKINTVDAGSISNPDQTATGTIIDNDDNTTEEIISFPKYFTPNGDGFHDNWNANTSVRDSVKFIWIFDRYGKLLKQLSPLGNGWNGEFNGRLLPAAEYWFKAEFKDGTYHQGHFSLIR